MGKLTNLVLIVTAGLVALLIPATRNFIIGSVIGILLVTVYLYLNGSTLKWEKK